jgi:hypothetical protein
VHCDENGIEGMKPDNSKQKGKEREREEERTIKKREIKENIKVMINDKHPRFS